MAKIRILATEDDPIHEEKLIMAVDELGYELIDVLNSPDNIMSIINATKPDILLMDIDLGADISGIELVKKINETHDIPTVYLTSFTDNETFQEAKKTIPAAYVTKPYDIFALQTAIEIAIHNNVKKNETAAGWSNDIVLKDYVFIKEKGALTKVTITDIKLVEAYDKYCYIHTEGKRYMLNARLKNIVLQLPTDTFCQVHRSYVVNLTAIDNIHIQSSEISIMGKKVSVSKSYKNDLFSRFNSLG